MELVVDVGPKDVVVITQCISAAVAKATYGCVHEHLEVIEVCKHHLETDTAQLGCAQCWDADQHRCVPTLLTSEELTT